jgi:hypothetical protein
LSDRLKGRGDEKPGPSREGDARALSLVVAAGLVPAVHAAL